MPNCNLMLNSFATKHYYTALHCPVLSCPVLSCPVLGYTKWFLLLLFFCTFLFYFYRYIIYQLTYISVYFTTYFSLLIDIHPHRVVSIMKLV
ncbi:hypothetical protein F4703DRAFT_1836454 [Phycomyces blakesleeanus]